MSAKLITRGQVLAYEYSPEANAVQFEGPAFEKFTRGLDRKLRELEERWLPHAAPAAAQPRPETSRPRKAK